MTRNPSAFQPFNLQNGMAVVKAGTWLASRGQPTAYRGSAAFRGLKGIFVSDRASYAVVETNGEAFFADGERPFLTHLPCAAPITAVADKVLLAPVGARTGAELVRLVPLSLRGAVRTTTFAREWLVLATKSRTTRVTLAEDEVFTVRADAAAAWTTKRPVGFVPRLRMRDVLLPRKRQENLMMHFYGPGIVWFEGLKG